MIKILHLDIETAPNKGYFWNLFPKYIDPKDVIEPGYTLCWSAMWEHDGRIMYAGLNTHSRLKMLREIYALLDEADAVVHYNGSKFDIPKLFQEFALQGWAPPSPFKEVDLLKCVRRNFKFSSNKLEFVAAQFGIGSKTKNMSRAIWHGCMNKCEKSWKVMERYNKQDVKLLRRLYKKLLPWIHNHPNVGLWIDTNKPTCSACGSTKLHSKGPEYRSTTNSYYRYKCTKCGTNLRARLANKPVPKNILKRI